MDLLCDLFVNLNKVHTLQIVDLSLLIFFNMDPSSVFISLKFISFDCRIFHNLDFVDPSLRFQEAAFIKGHEGNSTVQNPLVSS